MYRSWCEMVQVTPKFPCFHGVPTRFHRDFSIFELFDFGAQRLAASHHHGADAGVGEDFEQECMGNPAINDVGG